MTALMFAVKFVQFATYILCNCSCYKYWGMILAIVLNATKMVFDVLLIRGC